jgi:serine/threonine protein kinase
MELLGPRIAPQSRYTILSKIADGGTAEIFLAKQTGAFGFEKLVVLKRIFDTFSSDPQFRHMLIDEAHIAMTLSHSNIVQVLDLGEVEGRHFLALELVDGWTLDGVLKRAKTTNFPFPPALALYVTAEVCRALAYAHSKSRDGQPLGIVHRDVSPHNVLLSEHGEVKLSDFGIAKARTKHEQSLGNVIKGKIAFMSPEQAYGCELDARSDLFSLGVVLYLMITRLPPFDGLTDYETLMQVRAGNFLPPETARPRLNREVYRVIRKAMAIAPADRYQNATEMLVDVEQVLRLGFRPLEQTELARWLADLSAKDGVPPLTRAELPPVDESVVLDRSSVTPSAEIVTPTPSSGNTQPVPVPPASSPGTSVELDLEGADVTLAPPTPPSVLARPLDRPGWAGHIEQTPALPPPFGQAASFRKRATHASLVALLLAIGVTVLGIARRHEPGTSTSSSGDLQKDLAVVTSTRPKTSVTAAESEAARHSKEYARHHSDDEGPDSDDNEMRDARDKPATKMAQTSVSIESDPDGSRVRKGHRTVGVTPMSLKLRPGSYRLTFTKPGYLPTKKTVLVASGRRSIHVSLRRARARKPGRASDAASPETDDSWVHFSR